MHYNNETALISEVPNTAENENLIVAPGQGKSQISVFNDKFWEELAFPYLFPDGKFGYKVERDIPICPVKYFNQRLLNYTQRFAGDADYIFFARSVIEQHYLSSSINIAMKNLKPGTTVSSITTNYKDRIQNFLGSSDAFSFISSVKGTQFYWKQFLYDILLVLKQLGITTFFLTLSCANLKWDELISIRHKLNNSTSFDDDLRNLTYEECSKYLNSNPVLVAHHFQYRVQVFCK